MAEYFHSVRLDQDRCKGCTNCIKGCPTEAIRVRQGKAEIIEERCIDCGECIRTCQNNAKFAVTDDLDRVKQFAYPIALIAPSFFGQFRPEVKPEAVVGAFAELGFRDIFEVGVAAEAVSFAMRRALADPDRPRPLISSACPAVIRLIQVRFPSLIDNILRVEAPMEIAARLAKDRARSRGVPKADIGTFFVTPCPAKMTAVRQPVGLQSSAVDGAIAMSTIYGALLKHLDHVPARPLEASGVGLGWGRAGGEAMAVGRSEMLSVDGIHAVATVLEEVERGRLRDIDLIEAQACVGGCIGGPLVVQNPFIARQRLRRLSEQRWTAKQALDPVWLEQMWQDDFFHMYTEIKPRPVMKLDADMNQAIAKMRRLEEILEGLPGLDCGACGSPSCRAFAEDVVRGNATESDCVLKLRVRVLELAEQLWAVAKKVPPAMADDGRSDKPDDRA